MSDQESIKHLQKALQIARLPESNDGRVADADGNITAASTPYKFGYMETCIKYALAELGVQV